MSTRVLLEQNQETLARNSLHSQRKLEMITQIFSMNCYRRNDLNVTERDELVKKLGFSAYDYHE